MPPLLSDFLRKQRFKAVATYLYGDVLDLGCNDADILALLRPDQRYVGVDRNPEFIRRLNEKYRQHEFYQRDFDKEILSLGDRRFDTILMIAVIEHLKNPNRILEQVPRYLRSNGKLLITTPAPLGDKIHRIGARMGLFYKSALEEHELVFTFDSLQEFLARSGLNVIHYKRFLLGGNQMFVCESLHP